MGICVYSVSRWSCHSYFYWPAVWRVWDFLLWRRLPISVLGGVSSLVLFGCRYSSLCEASNSRNSIFGFVWILHSAHQTWTSYRLTLTRPRAPNKGGRLPRCGLSGNLHFRQSAFHFKKG